MLVYVLNEIHELHEEEGGGIFGIILQRVGRREKLGKDCHISQLWDS